MRYSRKEYCELCGYRFSFTPIYSPDMPRRLPFKDLAGGLLSSVATAVKYWLHYTLVAVAWLGIVPLAACRIYRALLSSNMDTVLANMITADNLASDIFHGCFVVVCTLFAFIGLVWLREQILHGGGPEWLDRENAVRIEEEDAENVNNNIPEEDNNLANGLGGEEGQEVAQNLAFNNVDENVGGDNNAEVNGGEENNWIPLEWDRAAEELTWERLLGLDGSLVFIEHVFWIISLNILFIVIFAAFPYHMGLFVLNVLKLRQPSATNHFEGLLTTLLGYCVVGISLMLLHRVTALFGLGKARRVLGLCYVVVKVSILSVVEIGILPLVCGWWLDICSLQMFDATLKDRESSFRLAPGTSIFIHWLVGMVYVYYFASFVLLLREILRPGVLWFLRNLNDPDFSPIQEMIHLPVLKHIRRLLLSAVIFGSAVLLMLWLPIRILRHVWPSFLPYTVSLNSEAQVNELSLELLLLQVILPALLEQSHTRTWLKGLVRMWCRTVAWLLDIHSYLLGDSDGQQVLDGQQQGPAPEPQGGLGAAHQALILREGGPTGETRAIRSGLVVSRGSGWN